jgi:hypothetical protein
MQTELEKLLEEAVERIQNNIATADEEFMRLCGQSLALVGIKTAQEARYYFAHFDWANEIMYDVNVIQKILQNCSKSNMREIKRLFEEIRAVVYDEAKTLQVKNGQVLLPFEEFKKHIRANPVMRKVVVGHRAMGKSSAASALYRKTIGDFLWEMTGDEKRINYPTAMRKAVQTLSEQGMSVVAYASGYKRRLDSSVRADLMDEFTEIIQGVERETADFIGADAWEISAHEHPAEDHADIQGKVFTKEEFEKLQAGMVAEDTDGEKHQIERAVGKWNCHHIAYPFILSVSERKYEAGRLQQIEERNEAGIEFRGKRMTLYEATQEQRKVETRLRRERGALACIQEVAGGDSDFAGDVNRSKERIKALRETYKELGERLKPANIRAKTERTYNIGKGRRGTIP